MVTQLCRQGLQTGIDLAHLTVYPCLALLRFRAQGFLQTHQNRRIQHAVCNRFPALHIGTLTAQTRNQFSNRCQRIQILHDDT